MYTTCFRPETGRDLCYGCQEMAAAVSRSASRALKVQYSTSPLLILTVMPKVLTQSCASGFWDYARSDVDITEGRSHQPAVSDILLSDSSTSQIFGCDGPGVKCSTKSTKADPGTICAYTDHASDDGIGIVSLRSMIASIRPLTWTLTSGDGKGWPFYATHNFWLGYPPSLNLGYQTDFGGCAMSMLNISWTLQAPPGFDDFAHFGCHTVMGEACQRDLIKLVGGRLSSLLNATSTTPMTHRMVGVLLDLLLARALLPP